MLGKILSNYKNISLPVKASLWFVLCSLVQKGISFLTTPLFTRLMTLNSYGKVVIYQSWMEIIAIIITFNLTTGVFNKAMIKYERDRDGYTSSSLFLTSILTITFFLFYLSCKSFWNAIFDLNTPMVSMLFIEIFISSAMSFWSIRNRFEYKYKSVIFFTLVVAVFAPVISVLCVLHVEDDHQAEARVFGVLLVKVVVYLIVFVIIFYRGRKYIQFDYWKYSLMYNLPLIPHYLSQQVLTQSDRIMISKICGSGDAAVYGVAYQLSNVCFIFTLAMHNSFTPWTFENLRDRKYKDIGKVAFEIELAIGIVCFLFSLFSPELISILGGSKYAEAIWIVPPVAMSILFQTIYTFFANIEFYYERTKIVMIASIFVAIANIILNSIFIPIYGFIAAGYTTMVCYVLYSIVHYIFMLLISRQEKIPMIYPFGKTWGVAIICIFLGLIASLLYRNTILRYFVVSIVFIVMSIYLYKNKTRLISKIKI